MEDFSYLCPQIIDNKISLNAKTYKIKEMKQFVIKAYDGEGKLDKRMEPTKAAACDSCPKPPTG